MAGQWKEVVKLAFKGPRFQDHALDLRALAELSQFQKIVAETAKAIWRAEHPGQKIPRRFEERTRLCLRRIEEGSAVAPLEVYLADDSQEEMFAKEPTEAKKAVALAHQAYLAIERDDPLPESFPKHLITEYQRWGLELSENEEIELIIADMESARVTAASRQRLSAFLEPPHKSSADIVGEVLEADIRQGRFQVWLDDKTGVSVVFSPEQEDQVTSALRDHRTVRLRVIGQGEFSPQGRLARITQIEELRLQPPEGQPYDTSVRPIEEVLAELAGEIPQAEWKRLPQDLTDNLDHYLYGTPKR